MAKRKEEISRAFANFMKKHFPQEDEMSNTASMASTSSCPMSDLSQIPSTAETIPPEEIVEDDTFDLNADEVGEVGSGSGRKKRFTREEKHLLVQEIKDNYEQLFGRLSDKLPKNNKSSIWKNIQRKVNAIGIANRSLSEILKKWYDCRRQVKEKLKKIEQSAKKTGGGPGVKISLNETEELVADTFRREQISGIGNFDVMEGLDDSSLSDQAEGPLEDENADGGNNTQLSERIPSRAPSKEIDDPLVQLSHQLKDYMTKNESIIQLIVDKHTSMMEIINKQCTDVAQQLAQLNHTLNTFTLTLGDILEHLSKSSSSKNNTIFENPQALPVSVSTPSTPLMFKTQNIQCSSFQENLNVDFDQPLDLTNEDANEEASLLMPVNFLDDTRPANSSKETLSTKKKTQQPEGSNMGKYLMNIKSEMSHDNLDENSPTISQSPVKVEVVVKKRRKSCKAPVSHKRKKK